jgi:hypothetical protein
MSSPTRLTLALVAAVANGIAQAQTPGAAGNLTLNGSLVVAGPTYIQGVKYTNYAQMDVARRISVASSGSDASVVFTITGFSRDGQPISQTVTGVVSGTPVATTLDFLQVTSVATSAATAGAITVGTNSTGSTAWVLHSTVMNNWALAEAVYIVSGSVTYTVEHTYDDPNAPGSQQISGWYIEEASASPPVVWPTTGLSALSASGEANYANQPVLATRMTITAGTGTAAFYSIQNGIRS